MTDENVFIGKCQMCGKKVYAHPNDIPTVITEVFCSRECHNKYYEIFPKTMKNEKGEMKYEKGDFAQVNYATLKEESEKLESLNKRHLEDNRVIAEKDKIIKAERSRSAKLLAALKDVINFDEADEQMPDDWIMLINGLCELIKEYEAGK